MCRRFHKSPAWRRRLWPSMSQGLVRSIDVVEPDGAGRGWVCPWWHEAGLVLACYSLLTVIATYPAIRFLDTRLMGSGDTLQNMWNLWWTRWAAAHGNFFPLHTSMLYHPDGVSLAFHPLELFNGWLAVVCGTVLSMTATYNLISLLTFVGSGLAMYTLVRYTSGSRIAAFVAGIIFTFSPFRMSRVFHGNLELYSTQFIPLVVWSLARMSKDHKRRYAVGAAVLFWLTAMCSLYLAAGTGILVAMLFAFDMWGMRRRRLRLKNWGLFTLVTGALMCSVVLPMVWNLEEFLYESGRVAQPVAGSADVVGFFVPDATVMPSILRFGSPAVARDIQRVYAQFGGNPCEKTVFLGYTVLAMTAVSVGLTRSSAVRRWLLIAGVFFVLCLGPIVRVGGHDTLPSIAYMLLHKLPMYELARAPSRWAGFLMLGLAMVVGHGCAALQRRLAWPAWATALAGFVMFAEFLIVPLRLDARVSHVPAYYHDLARQDVSGAILDVPVDVYGAQGPASEYMLYQTVHHHPIVGGYIARSPRNALSVFERPLIHELRARLYDDRQPYAFAPEVVAGGLQDLRSLKVEYAILHYDQLSEADGRLLRATLSALLGDAEYEDNIIAAWRVASRAAGSKVKEESFAFELDPKTAAKYGVVRETLFVVSKRSAS